MTYRAPLQRGFAAIAAIFLVVVLAALGGFMVTFSNTQQLTAAQDIQGSRAYWAARAGLGFGVARVTTTPSACASSTPANMAGAPASVEGFALTVTCSRSSYTDGLNTIMVYRFESKASAGSPGSANYVERSVSAAVEM
jgi:MSHA biogenesis protein MshP